MEPLDPARIRAIDEQMQCHLDYCWAVSDPEVRARYADRMVAVCRKAVWGEGKDSIEAGADAGSRAGCPVDELIFVYVVPDEAFDQDYHVPEWPSDLPWVGLRKDDHGQTEAR